MAPKDEQPEEKAAEKGGGKMKLAIIIGVAVLVAVGATAGFFLMTGGDPGEKEAHAKTEKSEPSSIFTLDPFIVNIYDGQELRYLRVKVEMEVDGEETKTLLNARQAQIRDAILVLLTTKTMLDIRDLQGKNQLKQEIFAAVSKMFSPEKVRQVYFTDFVVQ